MGEDSPMAWKTQLNFFASGGGGGDDDDAVLGGMWVV